MRIHVCCRIALHTSPAHSGLEILYGCDTIWQVAER